MVVWLVSSSSTFLASEFEFWLRVWESGEKDVREAIILISRVGILPRGHLN